MILSELFHLYSVFIKEEKVSHAQYIMEMAFTFFSFVFREMKAQELVGKKMVEHMKQGLQRELSAYDKHNPKANFVFSLSGDLNDQLSFANKS